MAKMTKEERVPKKQWLEINSKESKEVKKAKAFGKRTTSMNKGVYVEPVYKPKKKEKLKWEYLRVF